MVARALCSYQQPKVLYGCLYLSVTAWAIVAIHSVTYQQPTKSYMICESMVSVERKLTEMKITYIQRRVEEGGVYVDQLFFHDPDGFMIEICNCDNLPVIPLTVGEHSVACKRMKQKYCQPAAIHVHVKESNMTPVLEA